MKKKLLAILALSLGLVACNQGGQETSQSQTEAVSEERQTETESQPADDAQDEEVQEEEDEEKADQADDGSSQDQEQNHYPVTMETYGFEDEKLDQVYEDMPVRVISAALSGAEELLAIDRGDSLTGIIELDNEPTGP